MRVVTNGEFLQSDSNREIKSSIIQKDKQKHIGFSRTSPSQHLRRTTFSSDGPAAYILQRDGPAAYILQRNPFGHSTKFKILMFLCMSCYYATTYCKFSKSIDKEATREEKH